MNGVRGYKVFNSDWTCRGKQYSCPGTFEEDVKLKICKRGMHFCQKVSSCFDYYSFDSNNKVAEVVAYGEVITDGEKSVTNKLEIVREISWEEVLEIVNTGKSCTGLRNSGNCNSGDWNSGNCNSGDWNSGNRNSGDWNSGDWNSGNCNSGDRNSGNCNSGDWNSGNCNSGNWNSGNRNSGNWNSGDWNSGSFSNGCFNTAEPKIYLFNKLSDWTYMDWLDSDARYLLNQITGDVLEYVWFEDMTDEERAEHPEAEVTGGYLKESHDSKTVQDWWDTLSEEQKKIIKSLPNFDAEIFKKITGIEVEKDE